ncbi:Ig-like domain-containing protein [Pseudomonas sp. Hp2]|uniref:Ig-like domain-containing protein n=1 Tax=Pseudomonas sp. Hp2 TaxID=701189 RepID=UPI0035571602
MPTRSSPPGNTTLAATASDQDGTISKVEYYQGSTKIDEATASPYTVTWSNVPGRANDYVLTARATDNRGVTTDSGSNEVRFTYLAEGIGLQPMRGACLRS